MDSIIAMPDGYNGHVVYCFATPIERDGHLVKLAVAEPGKEYMFTWARIPDVQKQLKA